jgi:hypothetical protein
LWKLAYLWLEWLKSSSVMMYFREKRILMSAQKRLAIKPKSPNFLFNCISIVNLQQYIFTDILQGFQIRNQVKKFTSTIVPLILVCQAIQMSTGMGTRCHYTESCADSGMSVGPLCLLSQADTCCMNLLRGCLCTRLTLLSQYTWVNTEFFPNALQ